MSNLFHDEGPKATGKKVMLATTSYGDPAAAYTFSIARSRQALDEVGIPTSYLLLVGNCHVDDARNAVVREFLASDCSHLMFLDADVSWEPSAIVRICQRDKDIVGGVYPYRRDGGEAMPVRIMSGRLIDKDGLLEVDGLPTGFMLIARQVFDEMAPLVPWYFDKTQKTLMFFDRPDPDDEGTRWGGDIAFCNRWKILGGKLFADAELRLGHSGDAMMTDSLGAFVRRLSGTAFDHLMPKFRDGVEDEADYNELCKAVNNTWGVDAPTLALCVGVARKCRGPIIETGSGLSSVMMSAVSRQPVHSLEHVDSWAAKTQELAKEAGAETLTVHCAPLVDFWYQVPDLPEKFTLGVCDGPPRMFGTRLKFLEVFGDKCEVIIIDDAKADMTYLNQLQAWADSRGRSLQLLGRCALITKASHAV